jgi:hypothetical protein
MYFMSRRALGCNVISDVYTNITIVLSILASSKSMGDREDSQIGALRNHHRIDHRWLTA